MNYDNNSTIQTVPGIIRAVLHRWGIFDIGYIEDTLSEDGTAIIHCKGNKEYHFGKNFIRIKDSLYQSEIKFPGTDIDMSDIKTPLQLIWNLLKMLNKFNVYFMINKAIKSVNEYAVDPINSKYMIECIFNVKWRMDESGDNFHKVDHLSASKYDDSRIEVFVYSKDNEVLCSFTESGTEEIKLLTEYKPIATPEVTSLYFGTNSGFNCFKYMEELRKVVFPNIDEDKFNELWDVEYFGNDHSSSISLSTKFYPVLDKVRLFINTYDKCKSELTLNKTKDLGIILFT